MATSVRYYLSTLLTLSIVVGLLGVVIVKSIREQQLNDAINKLESENTFLREQAKAHFKTNHFPYLKYMPGEKRFEWHWIVTTPSPNYMLYTQLAGGANSASTTNLFEEGDNFLHLSLITPSSSGHPFMKAATRKHVELIPLPALTGITYEDLSQMQIGTSIGGNPVSTRYAKDGTMELLTIEFFLKSGRVKYRFEAKSTVEAP